MKSDKSDEIFAIQKIKKNGQQVTVLSFIRDEITWIITIRIERVSS